MRRILLWLMSTLTVLVLLFGYHTSLAGAGVTATPPAAISGSTSGASSSASGSSGSGASGGRSSGSASSATTTVTGDVAQTQWGPVEVRLTLKNGTITAVDVPVYPNGNGRDYEINSYALPQLVQETLSAQSAQIDMVSGATVTSGGYLQSLQSALDKAKL